MSISGSVSFQNNICKSGAGIYFTDFSQTFLSSDSHLEFVNNVVALGGRAIYADLPFYYPAWSLFSAEGNFTAAFVYNQAHSVGDSVYLNIPVGAKLERDLFSEHSPLYLLVRQSNFSGSIANEIATSPFSIKLASPAKCVSTLCDGGGTYFVDDIMLGEVLPSAEVVDYFNNTAEISVCFVSCVNCTLKSVYQRFIYSGMSQNISIIGEPVGSSGLVLTLQIIPFTGLFSGIPSFPVLIEVSLSPCHVGYEYSIEQEMCTCHGFHGAVVCSNPN